MADLPQSYRASAAKMKTSVFWKVLLAQKFPILYKLASRLFSIPTSSAASERVWSVFDFIHSARRNRLGNDRVSKLVFLYSNNAIVSAIEKEKDLFEIMASGIDNDDSDDEEETEE